MAIAVSILYQSRLSFWLAAQWGGMVALWSCIHPLSIEAIVLAAERQISYMDIKRIHPLSIEAIVLAVQFFVAYRRGCVVSILYQSRLSFWHNVGANLVKPVSKYPSSINRGYRSGKFVTQWKLA